MNRFKIWVVEDRLAKAMEIALKRELGTYADWEVFPEPGEPIRILHDAENLQAVGLLPDVILIDVNFDTRTSDGALEKVNQNARGFIVAAELKHAASSLNKDDFRYRIYTGNDSVREQFEWVCRNPYEHAPLLPIEIKSDPIQPFQVLTWMREEVHSLAAHRLRTTESDLSVIFEDVDKIKVGMEVEWNPVWAKIKKEFDVMVIRHLRDITEKWTNEVALNPRIIDTDMLPMSRLENVRSVFGLLSALEHVYGDKAKSFVEPLRQEAQAFKKQHGNKLNDPREAVLELAGQLISNKGFVDYIGPLCPFEANELAVGTDPGRLITALTSIINLLGTQLDHNYTLLRAFKSLQVPNRTYTVPTTIFAHACHTWHQEVEWNNQFPFTMPTTSTAREALLRAELGYIPSENTPGNHTIAILPFPEPTRSRIHMDGAQTEGMDGEVNEPLVSFAWRFANGNGRKNWQEDAICCLQRAWPGLVHGDSITLLTDWRHLIGLVCAIVDDPFVDSVKSVRVEAKPGSDDALLTWDFQLASDDYIERMPLNQKGGDLRRKLTNFLGWGRLTVFTNSRNTCYMTRWPGGEPIDCPGDTTQPIFRLELSIRNYLRTRAGYEAPTI